VETRKAADLFSSKLKPLDYDTVDVDLNPASEAKPEPKSLYKQVASRLRKLVGLSNTSDELVASESSSPIVFCYSLFYVYYDQYTYITGVLSQDVMMGVIGIFVAIQVSNFISLTFSLRS
jgi:hypothetical protein